jgi:hypothetical protein
MDNTAMEKLISAIVAETVKSIVPAFMASMNTGKPEIVGQSVVEYTPARNKKAGKLIKSAGSDVEAFTIVKKHVLARKAGKIEKGPFLTCYRHIFDSTTLEDVARSSKTAILTLHKEAQKVLNYRA